MISQGSINPGQTLELWQVPGPGVITYMWWTSISDPVTMGNTVFNYYVDDDPQPLSFTLDMLAGIGFDDNEAPWVSNLQIPRLNFAHILEQILRGEFRKFRKSS